MRPSCLVVAAVLPLFPFLARGSAARGAPADALFHGGNIVTVDADFSQAEAMAVRNGRILATGTLADLRRHHLPGHTTLIDLQQGDLRSINPYNPFLGMWTTLTRRGRWYDEVVHESEALTRAQAIRFYTLNNAHLLFWEKEIGSPEAGKRADFIVIDRDLLTCPVDDIRTTQVLEMWIEGRQVFRRDTP